MRRSKRMRALDEKVKIHRGVGDRYFAEWLCFLLCVDSYPSLQRNS
ncbi:hypothetical protein Plhal304r1_c024g0081841 [Plasmopara halstedii]